ncbi:hypothetical protein [Anabaena sp. PCC 7108]|uniref:hypothetical protein n=1 Tax=Anabaena sp. PCC 7108 TaxID=163908 RepID=UPI00034578B7|nr:hypothetical protein [Anabaena sp. PCC 7108]
MLNNISKFIPQGNFKFQVFGLLVTVGVLGLGVIGQRTKINLQPTAIAADLPGYTNQIQNNNDQNSLVSRLRNIRDQSSQFQLNPLDGNNLPSEALTRNSQIIPTTIKQQRGTSAVNLPQKDGTYLYGQSSAPDQLGQGYIVFQKQQGKVIGALYMPSSEFSCFQGTIANSGELAMTVRSSPGEVGTIQVSTTSRIPHITDDDSITYAYSVTLQDYHPLKNISANDRKILQMCNQQ